MTFAFSADEIRELLIGASRSRPGCPGPSQGECIEVIVRTNDGKVSAEVTLGVYTGIE